MQHVHAKRGHAWRLQLIDEEKPDETETAWVLARATAAGAGTATVASAIRFFLYGRTTAPPSFSMAPA